MSKIIFCLFTIILVSAAALIKKPAPRDITSISWGKARGDVAVRIIERSHEGQQMALTGEVQTEFESMEVEWKLPEGVTLVEGSTSKTLYREPNEQILRSHITVNVPDDLADPHLIFFAHTDRNGNRTGQSRVFNLKKTSAGKEHIEKIKSMMVKRGRPVQ